MENEEKNPTLPGAMIMFAASGSSGRHEDHLGIGSICLDLTRPGHPYPHLDIGRLYYSDPTKHQLERIQKGRDSGDIFSEEYKAHSDHHRRLSFKQAQYLQQQISAFIMERFQGVIPPDDEIDELMRVEREIETQKRIARGNVRPIGK